MSEKPKRGRGGFRIFLTFLVTAIVLAVAIAGAGLAGYAWFNNKIAENGPQTPDNQPRIVVLERGSHLGRIADTLEAEGAVTDARFFEWAVRIDGGENALKAGEYAFPSGASINDLYRQIREGRVLQHPVTIPEGWPSVMVADIINEADVLSGDPVEPPAEGSILPETYMVQRGTDRAELLDKMRAAQDRLLADLWAARDPDLPFQTQEEAIILASVVEKETGIAAERPHVAGVFVNRLKRGMKLESDPTIIYGVTQGRPLGRGIRRSEIDAVTDWNTYQITGLPKTPIANPGADAIRAVLNPPETDDLFFVADGTGGHVFASSYREHQRNVARWRQIERERRR